MPSKIKTIPFTDNFIIRLKCMIEEDYIRKGLPAGRQGKDLRRLKIVFGGHRPALFLKKELSNSIKGVFYPPSIVTIDELMAEIVPYRRMLSDLDHCYLIFTLAQKHAPEILKGRAQFVHFLPWAREIIHFIEQLDLENTTQEALLNLKAQAKIGFDVPADINQLLKSLFVLRKAYHAYLDKHQLTSRGYRYAQASEKVGEYHCDGFDEIWFCNFFYLHRSENKVIKNLYDRQKASLIIQGDQRRWPALKRIANSFDQEIKEGVEVKDTTFRLNAYAAFDSHAQAGLVAEILQKIKDKENTVIVLPQADSLLPLLSTIAPLLGPFNISLGYPLRRSAIYMLLDFITTAQQNLKIDGYYSRDYLKILRHPLIKSLSIDLPNEATAAYIHQLDQCLTGTNHSTISGLLFIKKEDVLADEGLFEVVGQSLLAQGIEIKKESLKNLALRLHMMLFENWEKIAHFSQLSSVLESFSAFINHHTKFSQYPLNEHVNRRLMDIAREWATVEFDVEDFQTLDLLKIMKERLGREVVAFKGSPLTGLQVLGLIETRSLSFDNVIIVDVNEGVLPNLNIYEPLIPREVMIALNIDRLELEEEIQRYQFMRLISSAKNVHLIYQERADKERSRFVEELIWREEVEQQKINVLNIHKPAFAVHLTERHIQVEKTIAIVDFLKTFTFSATSINTYKRNPFEFYQNYVLGLRPKEDLLEDPQGKHVGVFVHGLLEEAFNVWTRKTLTIDDRFKAHVMKMFEERFDGHFGRGQRSDAFLLKVVLENRLQRFLELESKRVAQQVEKILHIEAKFTDTIDLPVGRINVSLRMDRVEQLKDGSIVVIDYKTGNVDESSVQMPLYLNYLQKQYPKAKVNAAYYMLKTQAMDYYISSRETRPIEAILAEFKDELNATMVELFNEEIPFIDRADQIK